MLRATLWAGALGCPPDACLPLPNSWRLWAELEKALGQRTYELLTLYDWIPKEDGAARELAIQNLRNMEVAKDILCSAAFAECDPEAVSNSLHLLHLDAVSKVDAAQKVLDVCATGGEDWIGRCSLAIWEWADAEYFVSAKSFMHSDRPQSSEESDRLNLKKTDANAGYSAVVYPPSLSPKQVCESSLTAMLSHGTLQPVFSGEAFGDVSWVDVSNLRTRHLSAISLLETLENSQAFQEQHPNGLSRVAVNLGGGDGVCRVGHGVDPVNCFFVQGFGGVVFEANRSLEKDLRASLGHLASKIDIIMEPAEPETVNDRLERALALQGISKKDLDIIKVDVDGLDCHLVQALTASGWRPKLWHVEVNPLFPPRVALWPQALSASVTTKQQDLTSAFSRRISGKQTLVGCSLQALLDAAGSEYVLVQLEFENAVLVRKDLSEGLEPWLSSRSVVQKWRDGYFCHPIARVRLPHDRDEDSLFLRYDFRRWGDPTLSEEELTSLVKAFLHAFISEGSYSFGPPEFLPSARRSERRLALASLQDPSCDSERKYVFQWPIILGNIENLLQSWASGRGDLEVVLAAIVEDFASRLNIDRAWPIFKTVANAECPLGGLAIATVMRWRCLSGTWKENSLAPATSGFFSAMDRQLPIIRSAARVEKSAFAAPLGCEKLLLRYIEAGLRRYDLSVVLESKWPIFELLSSMHSWSKTWPHGYP